MFSFRLRYGEVADYTEALEYLQQRHCNSKLDDIPPSFYDCSGNAQRTNIFQSPLKNHWYFVRNYCFFDVRGAASHHSDSANSQAHRQCTNRITQSNLQ